MALSGRQIVYTNQVPYETDILNTNSYKMADIAQLAGTILGVGIGNPVLVKDLACTAISPPGLGVTVGEGVLYAYVPYDATSYGVNPTVANNIYKQFINWSTVNLSTPAPTVLGDSIIHLVQVKFDTIDTDNVSRPYFNSADPTVPIFNNNYNTRQDIIAISLKTGTEGPSPSPPAPDAGFTGLYYVTVAYGQTVIDSGDITVVPDAPFITESLTQKVSSATIGANYVSIVNYQNGLYIYGNDIGTTNNYVLNLSPAITSYTAGQRFHMKVLHTNTTSSVININTLGNKNIYIIDSGLGILVPLPAGAMIANAIYELIYDGTQFQLLNPTSSILQPGFIMAFGGSGTLPGFLVCDFSEVSRTTYAALFNNIGISWGPGNGTTTFNLPQGQGNTLIGAGGSGFGSIIGNTVGSTGGDIDPALTLGQIPPHSHNINDASVGGSGGFLVGLTNAPFATSSTGSGDPVSRVQPSAVVNFLIKY